MNRGIPAGKEQGCRTGEMACLLNEQGVQDKKVAYSVVTIYNRGCEYRLKIKENKTEINQMK